MGFTLSLLRLSPQFLNSYNQLLPLYLRIPSCRCRPALCLAGPLIAVGARVVRWAVARAGRLGTGARSGGWRVAVLWAITPYPSPPQLSTLSGPSPALCLAGLPSSVVPLLPWLRARGVRLPRSAGLAGRSAGRRWLLGAHSITTLSTYSTSLSNSLTPHSYQLTKSYNRKPPVNIGP